MSSNLESTEDQWDNPYNSELFEEGERDWDFSEGSDDQKLGPIFDSELSKNKSKSSGSSERDTKSEEKERISKVVSQILSNELYVDRYTAAATQSDMKKSVINSQRMYQILNDIEKIESETEIPQYINQNTVSEEEVDEATHEIVDEILNDTEKLDDETSIREYLLENYDLETNSIEKIQGSLEEIDDISDIVDEMKGYYNKSIEINHRGFIIESVGVILIGISIIAGTFGANAIFVGNSGGLLLKGATVMGLAVGLGFIIAGVFGVKKQRND